MICVFLFSLVGCGAYENEARAENGFYLERISYSNHVTEYRDTETGVHYLIYKYNAVCWGCGGICPRYNADGTLYVD